MIESRVHKNAHGEPVLTVTLTGFHDAYGRLELFTFESFHRFAFDGAPEASIGPVRVPRLARAC